MTQVLSLNFWAVGGATTGEGRISGEEAWGEKSRVSSRAIQVEMSPSYPCKIGVQRKDANLEVTHMKMTVMPMGSAKIKTEWKGRGLRVGQDAALGTHY